MTVRVEEGRPAVRMAPEELAKRLSGMQPHWPRPKAEINCAKRKCVALTFDDGPGDYTAGLLDLLRERGVRATFFVVGQMVAADRHHTLQRMVQDGHELGNHSWSHAQLTGLSSDGIRAELARTQDIVADRTGVEMQVMRPPYGSTDGRVATESRREGLAQILWNVDTLDWRDRVASVVTRRAVQAGPGSIVLMHDIHRSTVAAVPSLVASLSRRGFDFVTVSELYGKRPAPGRKYTER
ncbi:polysaccharide deacetylase family protein [Nonomuraea sp. NPDC050328]|uniref:polysaccharide deacetylase family protein n=1 Tax=Nonomuraea sp. NPDC050328 TaxID=3364361 RepID=UPI0037AF34E3